MIYSDFIAGKARRAMDIGIDVARENMPGWLFEFQRDIVAWALRAGRAAIFADTGLGKTAMQLAWASVIRERIGNVLILCPLAVAEQTANEAERFGIRAIVSRDGCGAGIVVANYERLHKIDTSRFSGVVLDESSILKSYDGKTKDEICNAFSNTPFRLACTATPAPNDHTELGNHAEFLGVCSRVEMLAEYFAHDGGSTSDWRLKGHAVAPFWRWVAGWGAFVRTPDDLGYDGSAWKLPPLVEDTLPIDGDVESAWQAGNLLPELTRGLTDERAARRGTMTDRVMAIAASIAAEPDEQAVVWCELNDESRALALAIDGAVELSGSEHPEIKAKKMLDFAAGKIRVLVTKPKIAGFGMNWQNCARCYFVAPSHSYEQTYQAIRRFWRFGQRRPVVVRTCAAPSDHNILSNLRRKASDADRMSESMRSTATRIALRHAIHHSYTASKPMELPPWM